MNAPARIPGVPAPIGDNAPPTPFELSREQIDGLLVEARNWLDGTGVQSEADAAEVTKLGDLLRDAIKTADARRVAENKPFDDGKAEVQARYIALIGNTKTIKGTAILAQEVCQQVLTPWLRRQEEARKAAAEAARAKAEEARREAMLAHQLADLGSLDEREDADRRDREARKAEIAAKRAEKPQATGLRTVTRAEVKDFPAFLRWLREHRPDRLRGALQGIAEELCTAKVRGMPGVTITEERVAR